MIVNVASGLIKYFPVMLYKKGKDTFAFKKSIFCDVKYMCY